MKALLRIALVLALGIPLSCAEGRGGGGGDNPFSGGVPGARRHDSAKETTIAAPDYERLFACAKAAIRPFGIAVSDADTGVVESRDFYRVEGAIARYYNVDVLIEKSGLPDSAVVKVSWNHYEPVFDDGTRFGDGNTREWRFVGTVKNLQEELSKQIFDSYLAGGH